MCKSLVSFFAVGRSAIESHAAQRNKRKPTTNKHTNNTHKEKQNLTKHTNQQHRTTPYTTRITIHERERHHIDTGRPFSCVDSSCRRCHVVHSPIAMSLWYVGALLSACGSISSNLGVNIQVTHTHTYFVVVSVRVLVDHASDRH